MKSLLKIKTQSNEFQRLVTVLIELITLCCIMFKKHNFFSCIMQVTLHYTDKSLQWVH
jgi:hypothetical protein